MPQVRAAAERMAVNHPLQGTAADIMKMAMIKIYEKLRVTSYELPVTMLLQVHDELVFEVPKDAVAEAIRMIRDTMEHVEKLCVPLHVVVKTGRSWGELEPYLQA